MTPKKNVKMTITLAIVLFVVGVGVYAFPEKKPENPVRMMFQCVAGKVMFTHKMHSDETGLKLACTDCHHHSEEEGNYRSCSECHAAEIGNTVPKICLDCHKPSENHHLTGDEAKHSCKDCHELPEGESKYNVCSECHEVSDIEGQEKKMMFEKRSDAFHKQCIGCHKEKNAGPVECNQCHVM